MNLRIGAFAWSTSIGALVVALGASDAFAQAQGPTELPRETPIVTGPGPGGGGHVRVFGGTTGTAAGDFLPFPGFSGGVHVAVGDVNGDGVPDIIVATASGAGHVKVLDGLRGVELRSFFPYSTGFAGGVSVAVGDVNGDGREDIITGAGSGGGPQVKVFDGSTAVELGSFFAFDPTFRGGVSVAAGDVNGDGRADVITGAGPGAKPKVKVFDGLTHERLTRLLAFDAGFAGGVQVAAGDVNGDGLDDIIVGAGPSAGAGAGPGPHVKAFRGSDGGEILSVLAFAASFAGGVSVAAGDVNGDGVSDVIVGMGPGAKPKMRVFDGLTHERVSTILAYDPAFRGGVFVAAGD